MTNNTYKEGSYKAKGKSPFVYSATYQMWHKAVLNGNKHEADAMHCHHLKQFGPPRSNDNADVYAACDNVTQ